MTIHKSHIDQRKSIQSIEFQDLSFGYKNERLIFDKASFKFPMNEFVWIDSESGAGRTTLLELLTVLQYPNSGTYLINGESVNDMTFEEFLPYRLNIGFGFDIGGLIQNRTLLDNITLPLVYHRMMTSEEAEARALTYMNFMGIDKHARKRPSMVPGGVRKIGCLVRALVHHPEVLLLDDPSVGVDAAIYEGYFHLINDLKEKGVVKHVYLSSFDEKLFEMLKPVGVVISDGRLHHKNVGEAKQVVGL